MSSCSRRSSRGKPTRAARRPPSRSRGRSSRPSITLAPTSLARELDIERTPDFLATEESEPLEVSGPEAPFHLRNMRRCGQFLAVEVLEGKNCLGHRVFEFALDAPSIAANLDILAFIVGAQVLALQPVPGLADVPPLRPWQETPPGSRSATIHRLPAELHGHVAFEDGEAVATLVDFLIAFSSIRPRRDPVTPAEVDPANIRLDDARQRDDEGHPVQAEPKAIAAALASVEHHFQELVSAVAGEQEGAEAVIVITPAEIAHIDVLCRKDAQLRSLPGEKEKSPR